MPGREAERRSAIDLLAPTNVFMLGHHGFRSVIEEPTLGSGKSEREHCRSGEISHFGLICGNCYGPYVLVA